MLHISTNMEYEHPVILLLGYIKPYHNKRSRRGDPMAPVVPAMSVKCAHDDVKWKRKARAKAVKGFDNFEKQWFGKKDTCKHKLRN